MWEYASSLLFWLGGKIEKEARHRAKPGQVLPDKLVEPSDASTDMGAGRLGTRLGCRFGDPRGDRVGITRGSREDWSEII